MTMIKIFSHFLLLFFCTQSVAASEISSSKFIDIIKLDPAKLFPDTRSAEYEKVVEYNKNIIDFINGNPQVVSDLIKSNKIDANKAMVFIINAYIKKHPGDFKDFKKSVCTEIEISNGKCFLSGYMLTKSDPEEELYNIYKINDEENLFVWKSGRGSHNDSFWLWRVKNTKGRFIVKLYRRDEERKGDYNKFELVAHSLKVIPEKNILVLDVGEKDQRRYIMKGATLVPVVARSAN